MQSETSRLNLVNEFQLAADETLFTQLTIAAVLCCSPALLEKERWSGGGIPYLKLNRRCLYRKKDVEEWLSTHKFCNSTSQYEQGDVK